MNLGYFEILKLGEYVSTTLKENGIKSHSNLVINVDKNSLHKIDEDLYYRKFPDGNDFQPSENEILVEFDNFTIQIKANDI